MNMFENYPFWHTFFTKLGYRVILSPKSSKKLFESGMDTIPSESICYPAKMAHGHVQSLIGKGVDFIFYPAVVYEKKKMKLRIITSIVQWSPLIPKSFATIWMG